MSSKAAATPSPLPSAKKRRQRKVRFGKTGKASRKAAALASAAAALGPPDTSMQPDLEDVEGVLFVSFTRKDALDLHLGDQAQRGDPQPPPETPRPPQRKEAPESVPERISRLERKLLDDLRRLRHRQVIHPVLQEVGMKLNSVDRRMDIDLKYLGVSLPLPPPVTCLGGEGGLVPQNTSPDGAVPFVSRTGKTNDFTKIKGWREKFSVQSEAAPSKPEGGAVPSESALKNRSAFCSDALDEYLEAEGKLIDQRAASFSPSAACAPVTYQLPTKSTSYVRTLDSVLKKQAPPYTAPRPSPASKPTPATPRKHKPAPKHKTPSTAGKAKPGKPAPPVPRPVHPAARHKPSPKPAAKSKPLPLSSLLMAPPPPPPLPPSLDEVYQLGALPDSVPLKQDGLGRGPGSSNSRAQGLSKNMLKLMDLEDGALWEGRPRTFITEERAEVALSSLLTAQGTLKGKPLGRMITRRAPPCLNDFCRLGCVCSSLFQERRLPTHCRKLDCMFGCTCLKRKVVLVKAAAPKRKKQRKAEERTDLIFYSALGEGEGGEEPVRSKHKKKRRRRKRRIEYTISEPEAESQPAAPRVLKLWTPVAGEIDPEPIFIPTPSACVPPYSPPRSPHSGKGSGKGYICKPSSAIRDEDKGPVYLYFESMMTCARVRGFDRTHKENTPCGLKMEREDDPNHMFLSALQGKSVKKACRQQQQQQGGGGSSEEPTKLIEIVAECDWERGRSKILNELSRRVNQGDLDQPFSTEGFRVELESQSQRREGGKLVITSRVRISQPGPREEEEEEEGAEREGGRPLREKEVFMMSGSEGLEMVSRKEAGVKGLPFYTGVSPAGLLTASKKHSGSSTQELVKVNGKSYPQAKLLLGQMGALHPANRLAAYITGRLRPTSLELSHVTSTLGKKARAGKEPQPASREADKRAARGGQAPSPATPPRAEASAAPSLSTAAPSLSTAAPSISTGSALTVSKLGMATVVTKPSVGNVFTQFVVNKMGSLQQSPPGRSPPHLQTVPSVVIRPALPARGGAQAESSQGPEVPAAVSSSSDEGPRLASSPATVVPVSPGIALPDRRPGTRLLLIPMPSAPPVRPPQTPLGPQFPPGQRMVLQPIRTPSGANLFRHPNGQIIQLVPLNQLRASLQPNVQHVVLRNQGSVIRLPAPPQPAAATDPSAASVVSPVRSSSVASPASGPTMITSSPMQKPVPAPSFVSQPGTLTFRISPPVGAGGMTLSSASLLPVQTGGFALLQVPKPAPAPVPVPAPFLTPATPKTPSSVPPAATETEKPGNDNPDNRLPSEEGEGEGQGESGVMEEEEEEDASGGNQEDADDKEEDDQGQEPKLTSSPSPPEPAQEQPGSPDSESETSFQAAAVSSDHSYTNGLEQRRGSKGQSSESDRSCLAEWSGGSAELEDPSPRPLPPAAASPPTPTPTPMPRPLRTLMDLKSSPVLILGSSSKSLVPPVAAAKPPVEVGLDSGSRGGLDPGSGGGVGGSGPGRPNESRADPSREALNLGLEDGEVEEEEEEDDKTDDSEDEFEEQDSEEDSEGDEELVVDSEASDSSEEEEDDEAIDIETVEELSEKISIARLKASAVQTRLPKESSLFQSKIFTKHSVKKQRRVEEEEELVEVETCSRLNHTANERRRRSEMRELFDKMKKVLGLHRLPKASKYYILKQAHNELQALEDQADRLQGQKNLLSRRRAVLVKKIAQTSGKTEELIMKKLEYISAKQKAVEMQRRKLGKNAAAGAAPREPPRPLARLEPPEPPLRLDSSHAGRPLILSRKRTAGVLGSSSVLSTGSLVVTPEGRLVSLKPALQTAPPTLAAEITSLPGVASVMIQLPGLTLPIQVKTCIPLPVPSAQTGTQSSAHTSAQSSSQSRAQTSSSLLKTGTADPEEFIMPRIVNVTSLAVSDTEKQGAPTRTLDSSLEGQPGTQEEPAGGEKREAPSSSATPAPEGQAEQGSAPLDQSRSCLEEERERGEGAAGEEPASPGPTAEGEGEARERDQKDGGDPGLSQEEEEDEDEDPEDDRLTSLLNEIVFLNQQHGSDTQAQCTQRREDEREREKDEREREENGSKGGVAHAVSPLFLQLAEELQDPPCAKSIDSDRQQGAPGEGDFVKIVLGSEFVDSGSGASSSSTGVINGTGQQGGALTPPSLLQHMRLGSSTSPPTPTQHTPADSEDWRPMPKLAPLALKPGLNQDLPSPPHSTSTCSSSSSSSSSTRYTKAMPLLAPVSPSEGQSSRSPPLLSQADC